MPSSVTLPTFSNREILLFQKLNAALQAIDARFVAGISSSDLGWPLTAEEDLNMGAWDINGGRSMWGVVNASTSNYTNFQDAVNAAGAGGVVLVPPETTISVAGITLPAGITVIGSGPSSVLQMTASTSADQMLSTLTGGASSGPLFHNLTLDGNSATGSGTAYGLVLSGVADVLLSNVWFKNFKGAMLKVQSGCDNVLLNNVVFNNGSAEHVWVTECDKITLNNVLCDGADGITIRMESASASADISATLSNVQISNCGSTAIKFLGSVNVGTAGLVSLFASNVVVQDTGAGAPAVILGTSAAALEQVSWIGGRIVPGTTGGILINANQGAIADVTIKGSGTAYGVDLDESQYVTVHDCVIRGCTVGIDGSGCAAECVAEGNIYEGCTTDVVHGEFFWGYGKKGVFNWVHTTAITKPEGEAGANAVTFVIPAHLLKVGSILEGTLWLQGPGVGYATDGATFKLNTQSLGLLGGTALNGQVGASARCTLVITAATTARRYTENAYATGNIVSAANVTGLDITAAQDFVVYLDFTSSSGEDAVLLGVALTIRYS